jgi:hypothetical protein
MAENAAASKVKLKKGDTQVPPVKKTATTGVNYVHKVGEVNISAYFPAEMKESLRMVQARTGNNVKQCLAEALCDLFKKYDVPVPEDLGTDRRSRRLSKRSRAPLA